MTLYISNNTKQHRILQVRFPGDHAPLFRRDIPSGEQIEITEASLGADHQEKFARIVQELDRWGYPEAGSVSQGGGEAPHLSYYWDKPITPDTIHEFHKDVVTSQEKTSAKEAVKAAAAFDLTNNKNGRGTRIARVSEVEIIQDPDPHRAPTDQNVKMSIAVTPEGGRELSEVLKV